MTLDTFKNTNPTAENISLLISSSAGVDKVIGLTVNITDCNFQNTFSSLSELTSVTLINTGSEQLQLSVENGVLYSNSYYYYDVNPPVVISTNSFSTSSCSNVIFTPPFSSNGFDTSDYNAILNNTNLSSTASYIYEVDRKKDTVNPTNLSSIISGTAAHAEVQESNYSLKSYTGIRYDGIKLTSGSIKFDDPALIYVPFEGSIHGVNLSYETIVNIPLSDRKIQILYFNPEVPNSPQTIPSIGRPVYEEQGNRFVRLKNVKFFIPDANLLGVISPGTSTQPPVFTTTQGPSINQTVSTSPEGTVPSGSVLYNYDISNYSFTTSGYVEYRDSNNNTQDIIIPPDTDTSICALTILTSTGVVVSQNGTC